MSKSEKIRVPTEVTAPAYFMVIPARSSNQTMSTMIWDARPELIYVMHYCKMSALLTSLPT